MPPWDAVTQADQDHTAKLADLKAAQSATATAESALVDAQTAYDDAKEQEAAAEAAAETAQAILVEVSKEVGIDYPPEDRPDPAALAPVRRRK